MESILRDGCETTGLAVAIFTREYHQGTYVKNTFIGNHAINIVKTNCIQNQIKQQNLSHRDIREQSQHRSPIQ